MTEDVVSAQLIIPYEFFTLLEKIIRNRTKKSIRDEMKFFFFSTVKNININQM